MIDPNRETMRLREQIAMKDRALEDAARLLMAESHMADSRAMRDQFVEMAQRCRDAIGEEADGR